MQQTELQKNAIAVARRKGLELYQRALDIQWLNSRMEDGRMGRCLALIQREADMEKDFQERTDHAAIVNARALEETKLGIEIAKVRDEESCKLQRRHYLRERDPSLRQLVTKLQAGYVCRDLQQQILHNQYKKLQEKAEDKHANDVLLNALYDDHQAKEREERSKQEKNAQYCKELQQQLVNRQRQRQCQYEDSLIERNMLNDVIKTMADEDRRELEQKRRLTAKMREEMKTFAQARDAWKRKQQQALVLEERDVERQRQAAADRSAAIIAERQHRMQVKEEINKGISAKILADEAAIRDRENIIKSLQEQEYLEKNAQDELSEKRKRENTRDESNAVLTRQMAERRRQAHEAERAALQFRKKSEETMAADEAKEREKQRRAKERGRQYGAELLRQIEGNRARRAKDDALDRGRAQHVWDCDKAWRAEVSEERKKIVEEHAPRVIGYLQAGVLSRHDLPHVQRGARAAGGRLAQLPLHSLEGQGGAHGARHPKCNPQCQILREY